MISVSLIAQNFWAVQIMTMLEIDKRPINAKIIFFISASKFEILFVKNISLALPLRQGPNILRYTLLDVTRSFERYGQ